MSLTRSKVKTMLKDRLPVNQVTNGAIELTLQAAEQHALRIAMYAQMRWNTEVKLREIHKMSRRTPNLDERMVKGAIEDANLAMRGGK